MQEISVKIVGSLGKDDIDEMIKKGKLILLSFPFFIIFVIVF